MSVGRSTVSLLASDCQLIVILCDCSSSRGVGATRAVTDRFPHAAPYSRDRADLGKLKLWGSSRAAGRRYVLGLYTNVRPGEPGVPDDAVADRLARFARCLRKIPVLLAGPLHSIAFPGPETIGPGAETAARYYEILDRWASTLPRTRVALARAAEKERVAALAPPSESSGDADAPAAPAHAEYWETAAYARVAPRAQAWVRANAAPPAAAADSNVLTAQAEEVAARLRRAEPALYGELETARVPVAEEVYTLLQELAAAAADRPGPKAQEAPPRTEEREDAAGPSEEAGLLQAAEDEYSYANATVLELASDDPPRGWEPFFQQLLADGEALAAISAAAARDANEGDVYPPLGLLFYAFERCALCDLKVLVLGGEPYADPGVAMGLAFATPAGVPLPADLRRVYAELEADGFKGDWGCGDLSKWAAQGVLLLHSALTVRRGAPGSHAKLWAPFTKQLLRYVALRCSKIAVVCWGAAALKLAQPCLKRLDCELIATAHPAEPKFAGSKPFSRANAYLESVGKPPVDWNLQPR